MKPHKHAELIKAWADGAQIQVLVDNEWIEAGRPTWLEGWRYRVKPEPKLYIECFRRVILLNSDMFGYYAEMENNALSGRSNNIKFIFDNETGVLKDAEVLK